MAEKNTRSMAHLISPEEIKRRELRDWFAGFALIGGAASFFQPQSEWNDYNDVAESCYRIADALMAEREKGGA